MFGPLKQVGGGKVIVRPSSGSFMYLRTAEVPHGSMKGEGARLGHGFRLGSALYANAGLIVAAQDAYKAYKERQISEKQALDAKRAAAPQQKRKRK